MDHEDLPPACFKVLLSRLSQILFSPPNSTTHINSFAVQGLLTTLKSHQHTHQLQATQSNNPFRQTVAKQHDTMTSTLNTPAGFSTKHGVKLDTDSRLPFVSDEVDMTTPEERHDEAAAIKSFLSQLTAAAFEGEDREEFLRELEEDIGEELEGLLGMGFEEDAVDEMEGILAAPKTSSNEDVEMSDSQQDEDEDEDEEMTGTDVIKVFLREHSMDFVEEEGLDHEMRGVDIESGSRIDDLVAVGHPVPV